MNKKQLKKMYLISICPQKKIQIDKTFQNKRKFLSLTKKSKTLINNLT